MFSRGNESQNVILGRILHTLERDSESFASSCSENVMVIIDVLGQRLKDPYEWGETQSYRIKNKLLAAKLLNEMLVNPMSWSYCHRIINEALMYHNLTELAELDEDDEDTRACTREIALHMYKIYQDSKPMMIDRFQLARTCFELMKTHSYLDRLWNDPKVLYMAVREDKNMYSLLSDIADKYREEPKIQLTFEMISEPNSILRALLELALKRDHSFVKQQNCTSKDRVVEQILDLILNPIRNGGEFTSGDVQTSLDIISSLNWYGGLLCHKDVLITSDFIKTYITDLLDDGDKYVRWHAHMLMLIWIKNLDINESDLLPQDLVLHFGRCIKVVMNENEEKVIRAFAAIAMGLILSKSPKKNSFIDETKNSSDWVQKIALKVAVLYRKTQISGVLSVLNYALVHHNDHLIPVMKEVAGIIYNTAKRILEMDNYSLVKSLLDDKMLKATFALLIRQSKIDDEVHCKVMLAMTSLADQLSKSGKVSNKESLFEVEGIDAYPNKVNAWRDFYITVEEIIEGYELLEVHVDPICAQIECNSEDVFAEPKRIELILELCESSSPSVFVNSLLHILVALWPADLLLIDLFKRMAQMVEKAMRPGDVPVRSILNMYMGLAVVDKELDIGFIGLPKDVAVDWLSLASSNDNPYDQTPVTYYIVVTTKVCLYWLKHGPKQLSEALVGERMIPAFIGDCHLFRGDVVKVCGEERAEIIVTMVLYFLEEWKKTSPTDRKRVGALATEDEEKAIDEIEKSAKNIMAKIRKISQAPSL